MKPKTVFYCTECGNETPKWTGKCPSCGAWNTVVEQKEKPIFSGGKAGFLRTKPQRLCDLENEEEELRFSSGMEELDRVLGGGAVRGSLILVGGAPGIGKSTLLLQICQNLCATAKVLYVSGEESQRQISLRAKRLGVNSPDLLVLSETVLSHVLDAVQAEAPEILIVDSIQTMYQEEQEGAPGSVGQVKTCTMALMQLAKSSNITVFVIGHVNKEGSIAGPKVLEHMVDCVLYFEGEARSSYRILRSAKNRFGATNEIGVFEMRQQGLVGVPNPSEMLLSAHPKAAPGTCVTCVMEGVRPILAEIQALLAPSSNAVPRRTNTGFDYNRCAMLLAVLEKHGGLKVSSCDVYTNTIGGLFLDEPAADLSMLLALASSYINQPLPEDMAALGEVGLTGELRHIDHLEQRLAELQRLGVKSCIIPQQKLERSFSGLTLLPAADIAQALQVFRRSQQGRQAGSHSPE